MRVDRYEKFVEKLTTSSNDSPALRMSKQAANKTEEQLTEYKAKKDTLTQLYTATDNKGNFLNDDEDVKRKVIETFGTEDEGKRNPFMQQLVTVLDLERRLKVAEKTESDDTLAAEDLRQQLSQEMDEGRKAQIQERIDKLKDKLADSSVATLSREATEARKAFLAKIGNITKEFKTAVDKIKTLRPK